MKKLALTLLVTLAAATAAVAVHQATPRSPTPATEAAGPVTAGQAEVRPGQIGYQQRRIDYTQIRRASPLSAPQIGSVQSSRGGCGCAPGGCRID